MRRTEAVVALLVVLGLACPTVETEVDGGEPLDAGTVDAGAADAGPVDAGFPEPVLPPDAGWVKLETVPYLGKQDDLSFIDATNGWYANGAGLVYRTSNGGSTWTQVLTKPGTYWRALGFIDGTTGLLGNIGTGVFNGVTDSTPLYFTNDGAQTVSPVTSTGPTAAGICAIDVLRLPTKTVLHAAGRVMGPAFLMRSVDGAATWQTTDLSPSIAMVTDVKFLSESVGFVVGGTSSDVMQTHAVILKTTDGAQSWSKVYESTRIGELIWKMSFPTDTTGYATVQGYDPAATAQRIVKTENGGTEWVEMPLVVDRAAREFGVGFVSADIGWVGTKNAGYQTTDGARTWQRVQMGEAVNKVRVIRTPRGFVAYAIGIDVFKLDAER